jgi:UDP-MurNAc hydroxylase
VRVHVLGHAGFLVETEGGSILCDPWFQPAFFGSWFPYPRNDQLSASLVEAIERPDYLYISHLHGDHLDLSWLADHVDRSATVLLPDYPTRELERTLRDIGFTSFCQSRAGVAMELGGVEVTILVETAIADGPQGDSAIAIADRSGHFVNQNDCRPSSFAELVERRPVDVHALQYSGAIWYPMVYEQDSQVADRLGRAKREAQLSRALQYVRMVDAKVVVPSAGPPAFLDPELIGLNDTDSDPANIFPDQTVFLDRLLADGVDRGTLAVPGTVIDIVDGVVSVTQPTDDGTARQPFTEKAGVLASYQADWMGWLADHRASWLAPADRLVERIAAWFEPLMAAAPHVCDGVGAALAIQTTVDGQPDVVVIVDFPERRVHDGSPAHAAVGFRFTIDRRLVETVVARRSVDWSNALFLSCRFRAWRAGDYNEFVYSFFKSLSTERIARAEAEAAAALGDTDHVEMITLDGVEVERFCPHRKADLATFGEVRDGRIVCTLHGWEFDPDSGRCLTTANGRPLQVRRPQVHGA